MTLGYLHPIWAVAVYAVAILAAQLLLTFGAKVEPQGRFVAIDGLRGLLALGVFICHAAVWFRYGTTGIWRNNPSPIYMHLCEASVVLFFMITGFLFWGKVLDKRTTTVDWHALYCSRWFRIMPLYATALLLMLLIAFIKTGFELHVSLPTLLWQFFRWLTFTLMGMPSVNGFREVVPVLGVAWSLRYEWLFYLALPLLAGFFRINVPIKWILISTFFVMCILLLMFKLEFELLPSFLFGMLAAVIVRKEALRKILSHSRQNWIVPLSLILACWLFPKTAYHPGAEAILFCGFVVIACGNTLGGLLTTRPIRLLGQISYSIYLLHSFVLYLLYGMAVRYSGLLPITPLQHWVLALAATLVLIGLCYVTWLKIEAPYMKVGHNKTETTDLPASQILHVVK
jgi:peptidoglycan/LPS O-acetylase OafA/YrhL